MSNISDNMKTINYLLENKQYFDLADQDIYTIKVTLKYIKTTALREIAKMEVMNSSKLRNDIESEINKYRNKLIDEIAKNDSELERITETIDELERKIPFVYPEYISPKRVEGVDEILQNTVENKKSEEYEKGKKDAKEKHDKKVKIYTEQITVEKEKLKIYKKLIANLSLLKSKIEKSDSKEFIKTILAGYEFSNDEYKKAIEMCAEGLVYGEVGNEFEMVRTPDSNETLIEYESNNGYNVNPEAITKFVNFIEENTDEINEILPIMNQNAEIKKLEQEYDKNNIDIERLEKEIETFSKNGADYENYLKNIYEMMKKIEKYEKQLSSEKIKKENKKGFKKIISKINDRKNKKKNEEKRKQIQDSLNKEKNNLIEYVQNNFSDNEYFNFYYERYLFIEREPETEDKEYSYNEKSVKIPSNLLNIICQKPWNREFKKIHQEILEGFVEEKKQKIDKSKDINDRIEKKRKEVDSMIEDLSPNSKEFYYNSEESTYWLKNNETPSKIKKEYPDKNVISGLDQYIIPKKNDNIVSRYISARCVQLLLDAKNIDTREKAIELGISINKSDDKYIRNVKDDIIGLTMKIGLDNLYNYFNKAKSGKDILEDDKIL